MHLLINCMPLTSHTGVPPVPHFASQVSLSAAARLLEVARSHDNARRKERSRAETNDLIIFKLQRFGHSEFELSATNFQVHLY